MMRIIISIFMVLAYSNIYASTITYTAEDSTKVVSLLVEGNSAYKKNDKLNLMLFYGKKFQGTPYVAHTLEVNKKEQLVVNLRQLDCTTFVETVLALCLTTRQGSVSWDRYCQNLQTIRYADGRPNGYPSRNHYFLWWVERNREKGIVTTPLDDAMKARLQKKQALPPYVKKQVININYMSTHSAAYSMLKGNSKDIATISALEKKSTGKTVYYIPANKTGLSKKQLGNFIQDGDILAIATKKKGLDTSHIGIAVWGKDGKLHLLNASQIHKKVVLEPMTLLQYMQKHPTQLGIWVIR